MEHLGLHTVQDPRTQLSQSFPVIATNRRSQSNYCRVLSKHQAHPRESLLHLEYTETPEEPYNKQLHMTLDSLIPKNSHKLTSQDKHPHNDTLIIFTCNSFGHASRIGSLTNSFSLVCSWLKIEYRSLPPITRTLESTRHLFKS